MSLESAAEPHHHRERSSLTSWSRSNRNLLAAVGLVVLSGGGGATLRGFLGGAGGGGHDDELGRVLTRIQERQDEQDRRLAQHDLAIATMQQQIGTTAEDVKHLVAAVRLVQENQLEGCAMLARVAHQPNPCRRPGPDERP